MSLPKVLIFTITYDQKDYCLKDFIESSNKLTYPNKRHIYIDNTDDGGKYYQRLKKLDLEVYRVERGNNSREALARSQNFARDMAIKEGYDYLFSLESDIFPPTNIIQKLMSSGKNVITGLYFIGQKQFKGLIPCITLPQWSETLKAFGTRLLSPEEFPEYRNQGIKRVAAGGFGCALIHKDVFKKIRFNYDPRFKGHSDIYFFNDLFRGNIPAFVDTDVICDHKNSDWLDVKDR